MKAANDRPGARLADELLKHSGPLVTREVLWRTLGFASSAAFRQAKARGKVGVKVFRVPDRRGTFAFTIDVADWLRKLDKEAPME